MDFEIMKYTVERVAKEWFDSPYLRIDKDGVEIMRLPVDTFDTIRGVFPSNQEAFQEIVHIIFNELNKYE